MFSLLPRAGFGRLLRGRTCPPLELRHDMLGEQLQRLAHFLRRGAALRYFK